MNQEKKKKKKIKTIDKYHQRCVTSKNKTKAETNLTKSGHTNIGKTY